MVVELSRCERNGVQISFLVHSGQDGPPDPWCVCRSCSCIGDECILAVRFWKSHHRLGSELFLQDVEGFQSFLWERTQFVTRILPR